MVDIDADSYHTPYDFKKYTAGLNSDLGQCGLSAILFQYTDWTEPPDPDRSRRDSLIRMCTDRFKRYTSQLNKRGGRVEVSTN